MQCSERMLGNQDRFCFVLSSPILIHTYVETIIRGHLAYRVYYQMVVLVSGKEKTGATSLHCTFLSLKITGKPAAFPLWHRGTVRDSASDSTRYQITTANIGFQRNSQLPKKCILTYAARNISLEISDST